MKEHHKKIIHNEAERIRDKIRGGYLYGEPIDMNDSDMVLFSAWLLCSQEQLTEKHHAELTKKDGRRDG